MILKLRHPQDATDYATSQSEVELMCDCHSERHGGTAKRTGITADERNLPVYRLHPMLPEHWEYENALVVLTPGGFKFILPIEMQETQP